MSDTARGHSGPLAGTRVVDLTEGRGLLAGKLLADMGADVILVEWPEGSPARSRGPFKDDRPGLENSLYFLNFNSNKRGITLNLDTSQGLALFKRLVTSAGILVEDYPIGRMQALGLDYPALGDINPAIILASITSFGSAGPYAQYKAPDLVSMAMGGLMYVNGPPDAAPVVAPCEQANNSVSVTAVFGIMAALLLRTKTGKGQHVEVSAQQTLATITGGVWQYGVGTRIPRRSGSQFGAVPGRIFPCRDGYIHILTIRPNHWLGLLEVLGNPEALTGDRWLAMEYRNANPDLIDAYVTEFTMAHDKLEIAEACQAEGVPCAPVNTPADFCQDPHIKQRGTFVDVEHPLAGRFPFVRPVCVFSRTACRILRPAPLLGQHNWEVYCEELGLTESELTGLKADGIV